MHKSLLLAAAALVALAANAADSGHEYVAFHSTGGSTLVVDAASLVMTPSGTSLTLSSPTVDNTVNLQEYTRFEFISGSSGIDAAHAILSDGPLHVYSTAGVSLGEFESVDALRSALPAGTTYVIKTQTSAIKFIF